MGLAKARGSKDANGDLRRVGKSHRIGGQPHRYAFVQRILAMKRTASSSPKLVRLLSSELTKSPARKIHRSGLRNNSQLW